MSSFFKDLFSLIHVTFIYENRWKFFLEGFGMTLLLTLSAFILGSLFGALLCALKLSRRRWIRKISSVFVSLLVQLPTLVLLMIFVYIIFGSVPLSVVVIVIMGLTLKAGSYLTFFLKSRSALWITSKAGFFAKNLFFVFFCSQSDRIHQISHPFKYIIRIIPHLPYKN